MRKRDRSSSSTPVHRPATPVVTPQPVHDSHEFTVQQQILFDVLRRTSLAEQKDKEIFEWLTDAAVWLKDCGNNKNFSPGSLAELRFLILGVLQTLPWWRVFDWNHVQGVRVTGRNGRQHSIRALTRWHERIQIAFERVCLLLMEQSQHAVRGVMEVAMKPFKMRSPVVDGALRLIPGDTIMRLLNAVATHYSSDVVLDVLQQCIRFLVPGWRWSDRRHHIVCIALFLHLALEAHIPLYSVHDRTDPGRPELSASQLSARKKTYDFPCVNSRDVSMARSEASTDAGASCVSYVYPQTMHSVPVRNPAMSMSDTEISDVSQSCASTRSSVIHGHTYDRPNSMPFSDVGVQNNKMLPYRRELIQFVLRWLTGMELSLQVQDSDSQTDRFSSPVPGQSGSGANWRSTSTFPTFVPLQVRPSEKPFVDILCDCTRLIFHRLAEDLRHNQTVGMCGPAEWWHEILAFHLNSVPKIECPIFSIYLAPSLAIQSGKEEATDMIRKLILLVTKGYHPLQQSALRTPAAGPTRVRMAPPTVGPLVIPMAHRVRAALHIYPLFLFLRGCVGNGEEVRKQILKWLVQELKSSNISHPLSQAQTGPQFEASPLVQVLFAQCAAISEVVDADFTKEVESSMPASRVMHKLLETYLIPMKAEVKSEVKEDSEESATAEPPTASPPASKPVPEGQSVKPERRRFDIAKMEAAGLLYSHLMDNCPWKCTRT
ncbi:hypothetical protein ERJ75_000381500 [Trypanosoma vivax]|nr:hypothetical protein TRVL_05671 [Trypanosoma vivax]KAH8617368.1 hypothetical protein ERJ75_000381500 [Trypanosoma vivax]